MPAEIYIRQIGQRDHSIAGRCIDAALLLLTLVLVISDTMTRSYFSIIFLGDSSYGEFLAVNFGIILLFAGIAAFQGDLFILIIFLATATFFLCYYLYFIVSADRPLNFNSLGSYYGVLAIIVFYVLARHKLLPLTMRIIFLVYARTWPLMRYYRRPGYSDCRFRLLPKRPWSTLRIRTARTEFSCYKLRPFTLRRIPFQNYKSGFKSATS